MKKNDLKKILNVIVYIFAAIGLFLTLGFFAVKLGLTNTKGIIDRQTEFFRNQDNNTSVDTTPRPWNQGSEWENFNTAISKDTQVLKRVESETGVPARLVVSVVFVEQMRLYFSERQVFKDLFAPLKILGTQTQFSLGVSGIKQKTAEQIENNLKDSSSTYYLGESFTHYLDFKTTDIENERFTRLTDYKDRYYSYLYTALYIKELATSWKKAGFDISGKSEILATLFNIGFDHSNPKQEPQIGGAEIDINGTTYSFGRLAGEFYYSNELTDLYPKQDFVLGK